MSVKIFDTMTTATPNFPLAYAEKINVKLQDGTEDNLQNLFDNDGLIGGGGDSSVTLTQQEYEALSEEQKLNGLYYTYDTKRIYKNGVQYGASDAEGIGYNNAESGIQATTVQGAIDKVVKTVEDTYAKKTDIPTTLPANGGVADIARQIVSPNAKTQLWEDSEGGNLRLVSPDGNHSVEMDLYNNEGFRMYFTDNGELTFPVDYNSTTKKFNINGNANTVNNHTVKSDVPENAKFTDTIYDDTEIKGSIAKLNRNLTENNVTFAVAGNTYITSYSAWNVGKEVFFNFNLKVNDTLVANAWYDIGNLSISPNQNFYYTCIYNNNQIGMMQITKDGLLKLYIGNVTYESNTAIIASGVYHI